MKFNIPSKIADKIQEPVVGNVYNVRGGTGAKKGFMFVIVAINDETVTVLSVNSEGDIVGGSSYGIHYFREKCPIAFCSSIEQLSFNIESLS